MLSDEDAKVTGWLKMLIKEKLWVEFNKNNLLRLESEATSEWNIYFSKISNFL